MSISADLQSLRDKVADIKYETQQVLDRIDSLESSSKDTMTPEDFHKKILNVFKAGVLYGRKEQHDSSYNEVQYGSHDVEMSTREGLYITGNLSYDDIGVLDRIMDSELSTKWDDLKEFTIENIDGALIEFKPKQVVDSTESNNETPES